MNKYSFTSIVQKSVLGAGLIGANALAGILSYPIVDTRSPGYYSNTAIISSPAPGAAFYGQDAGYAGLEPSYTDNNDGTITDNITGLVWQKSMNAKSSFATAAIIADTMQLAGYTDWRIPTIKELYSLILFSGQTATGITSYKKFIDTTYFDHPLGDISIGEREIDAQTWSATKYTGLTMNGDSTVFGVNFIDGRIKGYPLYKPGTGNSVMQSGYFRMVRGNTAYGINAFVGNGDGTITDNATGLMWQGADDGVARDWEDALAYCEDLTLANHSDWRLPNTKELQSIVDYNRSPSKTHSPAIDPLFSTTSISDPDGVAGQYPYFWTSTTHLDGMNANKAAAYIAFGEAQGKMNNNLIDVHGAGAQRSDPKSGDASSYPQYFGPQGDVLYVYNYARCARDTDVNTLSNISAPHKSSIKAKLAKNNLSFSLPSASSVQVRIANIQGEILATYSLGLLGEGNQSIALQDLRLGNGVHLLELQAGNLIVRQSILARN